MDLAPLPADLILEILKGHESVLSGVTSANNAAKNKIFGMCCPKCDVPLRPKPHPNPEVLFGTGSITYQAYCPACRTVVESP